MNLQCAQKRHGCVQGGDVCVLGGLGFCHYGRVIESVGMLVEVRGGYK